MLKSVVGRRGARSNRGWLVASKTEVGKEEQKWRRWSNSAVSETDASVLPLSLTELPVAKKGTALTDIRFDQTQPEDHVNF